MPDLFADAAGADGVNINTENYSVDPRFSDPVNGDFTIGTDSPAYASGDTTLDLAGSIISDSFAGTDIAFMDGSGQQIQSPAVRKLRITEYQLLLKMMI